MSRPSVSSGVSVQEVESSKRSLSRELVLGCTEAVSPSVVLTSPVVARLEPLPLDGEHHALAPSFVDDGVSLGDRGDLVLALSRLRRDGTTSHSLAGKNQRQPSSSRKR